MTFHMCTGFHSHELQVGKVVLQVRRRRIDHRAVGIVMHPRLFNAFIDPHGRWI